MNTNYNEINYYGVNNEYGKGDYILNFVAEDVYYKLFSKSISYKVETNSTEMVNLINESIQLLMTFDSSGKNENTRKSLEHFKEKKSLSSLPTILQLWLDQNRIKKKINNGRISITFLNNNTEILH